MKQTGIIMSGDHPRLILEGKKTMTRRTWGLEKINQSPDDWIWLESSSIVNRGRFTFHNDKEDSILVIKCPYGHVGDRLWVKETWYPIKADNMPYLSEDDFRKDIIYKTDDRDTLPSNVKWKPSIFMPRWASRILLEITEVKAERLQEISNKDIKAEGVFTPAEIIRGYKLNADGSQIALRASFEILWDSLNAKRGYPWAGNNWVWVIGFKK